MLILLVWFRCWFNCKRCLKRMTHRLQPSLNRTSPFSWPPWGLLYCIFNAR